MAETKVTDNETNFSKTVDANGWIVYKYGSLTQYRKRVTFNQTISGAVAVSISSSNLPVGISNFESVLISYSYGCSGNAYGLSMVLERVATGTSIGFTARSNDGTSRTYTGIIDVQLTNAT